MCLLEGGWGKHKDSEWWNKYNKGSVRCVYKRERGIISGGVGYKVTWKFWKGYEDIFKGSGKD